MNAVKMRIVILFQARRERIRWAPASELQLEGLQAAQELPQQEPPRELRLAGLPELWRVPRSARLLAG